jgi:hypothetical protein
VITPRRRNVLYIFLAQFFLMIVAMGQRYLLFLLTLAIHPARQIIQIDQNSFLRSLHCS